MATEEKVQLVAQMSERFGQCDSIVFADYRGLTVDNMNDLRTRCREAGVELFVAKNRLAKRALAAIEFPTCEDVLKGPTIFALGIGDAVAPAKVLAQYAKDNEKLELKGGILDKAEVDLSAVKTLATLPSREELLAKFAGSLAAPMTNFASAIKQIPGGLARALQAVADQKAA